jgi:curved DNA-binding protein CbpA
MMREELEGSEPCCVGQDFQGVGALPSGRNRLGMNGQLKEHPLGELIREISDAKLSGALRVARERVKVVLYLDAGEIIFAASNLRIHRLWECLRRWGVVSDEQLARVGEKGSDIELVEALVAAGLLDQQALEIVLARQVADVLRPALLWTDGTWDFDPRVRLTKDMRVKIETVKLLVESARRLPPPFAVQRFGNRNETISPDKEASTEFDLQPTESFILSRLDAPMRVHELVAVSGLPEAETLHSVYTLTFAGYLRRESWPVAFSPQSVEKAQAINEAVMKRAAATSAAIEEKPEEKKSAPVAPALPEEEIDEQRALDELFARLDRATDYYQVLGISRSSAADAVKRAYLKLAKRFHPDRFHQDVSLHSRVETAFTRIAQAYETLKDKQARAVYDLKLEREKEMLRASGFSQPSKATERSASTSTTEGARASAQPSTASEQFKAEDAFQQGVAALKQGHQALAVTRLSEAARLAPRQAKYRAAYARALAARTQTRRQAEAEYQAALAIEPQNASYRVMLAELYSDLGLFRRALAESERALLTDPKNAGALALLQSLRESEKVRK